MPALRRFPSRRWLLASLGIVVLLFGLAMLDPYPRQSLFGPKVDGIPWCVWEQKFRAEVDPEGGKESWILTLLGKVGLGQREGAVDLESPAALPIYLRLADDTNVEVRRLALERLNIRPTKPDEILPVLRRHLEDSDPLCRLRAAHAVWQLTKDPETVDAVLSLKDHDTTSTRLAAIRILIIMANKESKLFDVLSELTRDPEPYVRGMTVESMHHFGKRGVPVVRNSLRDPIVLVRQAAMEAAWGLGTDGLELIPMLQILLNDPEPAIRSDAAYALHRLDPERFKWGTSED